MLKSLHIYLGGAAQAEAITDFFADNPLFQTHGVIGKTVHCLKIPHARLNDAVSDVLSDDAVTAPAIAEIEALAQKVAVQNAHTVCLVLAPHTYQLQQFHIWVHLLRVRFPGVPVTFFLYSCSPDIEVEAQAVLAMKQGYVRYFPFFLQATSAGNPTINTYAASLGSIDASTITYFQDDGTYRKDSLYRSLFETLSIPVSDDPAFAPYMTEEKLFPRVKRDVVQFMELVNAALGAAGTQVALPWDWEKDFLAGGDTEGLLLSPEFRKGLWERYLLRDKNYEQLFDIKHYFSEARPRIEALYADWQPPKSPAWDSAVRLAKRLSTEFVRRVLEYPPLPEENLRKGSHLCLNAIKVVHEGCINRPYTSVPSKVAVLTATYNHAAFIEDTIKSVLEQQTNFPVTHIIADDASVDGTQDIIMEYARKHSSITPVFQKKRSGGHLNYTALFERTASPYVALCDGDDYFTDPDKLQTQVDLLDAHPHCALCFHQVRVTYEGDHVRERLYPPLDILPRGVRPFYYLSDLFRCNFIQTNSAMYRWRFTEGLPDWFRTDLMPGDWYWHLLHAETGKIGYINKVMSVYRRHKQSVYYLAEVDRLKHRHTVGMQELETYDAVNEHFEHRFEPILLDLSNGVFADCLLYCDTIEDNTLLEGLVDKYPRFAKHFLASLQKASERH